MTAGTGRRVAPEDIKTTRGSRSFPGGLRRRQKQRAIRAEKIPAVKPFGSLESDLPQRGFGRKFPFQACPIRQGVDVTKNGANDANYKTDLSRSEFESQLSAIGLGERAK